MSNKPIFKNPYYLSVMGFIIVSFLLLLLFIVMRYEENIEKSMFDIATSDVFQITKHKTIYIKTILGDSDNYIKDIKSDENLRLKLEKSIRCLITDNIKYAYILYKDKNDVFRFLVDGSDEDEKSMLNQKFDVTNKIWYELYDKKEATMIKHEALKKLSISYLVPILNNDNVELVLVIDFSINKISGINQILSTIKTGIILIISIMIISSSIMIFQMLRYKKMKKNSFIDKLTNIYNRNYLHEVENKLDLKEYILSVLDIDHFKQINDTYGHDFGDKVLKEVGKIFLNTFRADEDIAIRYGGEEFVILTRANTNHKEESINVIKRIFSNIKNHKMYIDKNEYINITVSIGINKTPGESRNFMDAFNLADNALYDAKNCGRDMIKIV